MLGTSSSSWTGTTFACFTMTMGGSIPTGICFCFSADPLLSTGAFSFEVALDRERSLICFRRRLNEPSRLSSFLEPVEDCELCCDDCCWRCACLDRGCLCWAGSGSPPYLNLLDVPPSRPPCSALLSSYTFSIISYKSHKLKKPEQF